VTDSISYSQYTLVDLLDAFASNEPVPGGGSASALAGALGVSLLVMVAGLPKTRTGTPEEAADLAQASSRLRPLRDALVALVDRDSDAYRSLLRAFRLPKQSEPEQRTGHGETPSTPARARLRRCRSKPCAPASRRSPAP
jgi:formiminotetrahydrofolate cyclodeaminase